MTYEKIRLFLAQCFRNLSVVMKEVSSFVKRKLCHKKIVIISDNGIVNIPISFGFQACVSVVAIILMLWVSYSTDKYFSYDNIISKKDREIWTTNITNENLQYQVADLHNNLLEMNKYFDNIRRYDQLAQKKIFDKDGNSVEVAGGEHLDEEVRGLLASIREKVVERIGSLESIIEMTGLKVEEVARQNDGLNKVIMEKNQDAGFSNQGGIFIPDDGSSEFDKEVGYLMELEKLIHTFPLSSPLERYWVSSTYGRRIDPIRKRVAMHSGMDMVGRYKAKVHAPAPGVVKTAGVSGAYGRMVEIDHGSGVTTRYGHLSKVLVERGQKVSRGDVLGLQGTTGRSTGDHLHYEVRYNGRTQDPINFLKAGKYVF